MQAFTLQDWTTIRGGMATVTQAEPQWLDLQDYQDVFFWLQVAGVDGSPSIAYQTSPTADETMFASMLAAPMALVASQTPVVTSILMLASSIPLARFVRWQLTGTPTWDVTFRIMVAANAPGL